MAGLLPYRIAKRKASVEVGEKRKTNMAAPQFSLSIEAGHGRAGKSA
jgi:hypothetical protein